MYYLQGMEAEKRTDGTVLFSVFYYAREKFLNTPYENGIFSVIIDDV